LDTYGEGYIVRFGALVGWLPGFGSRVKHLMSQSVSVC
jgi:hypothetical protein